MKVFLLVIIAAVILLWLVYQHVKDNEAEAKEVVDYLLCRRDPDPKEPDLSLEAKASEEEECSKEQTEKAGGEEGEEGETSKEDKTDQKKDGDSDGKKSEDKSDSEKKATEVSTAESEAKKTVYGYLNAQRSGEKNLVFLDSETALKLANEVGYTEAELAKFLERHDMVSVQEVLLDVATADYETVEVATAGLIANKAFAPQHNGVRNYIGQVKPAVLALRPTDTGLFVVNTDNMKSPVPGLDMAQLTKNFSRVEAIVAKVTFVNNTTTYLEMPAELYCQYKNQPKKPAEDSSKKPQKESSEKGGKEQTDEQKR